MMPNKWLETFDRETVVYAVKISFVVGSILALALLFSFPYLKMTLPDPRVDLEGQWKISLDDQGIFKNAEFNDADWESFTLPGNFILKALNINSVEGACWLRKKVVLGPDMVKGNLGICLGRIGNADEVYFNGVRIGGMGQFPPHEFSMWNHPRNYLIPEGIIHFEQENTIAIRVSYFGIGEVLGRMFISNLDGWSRYSVALTFTQITMGYITIAMGCALLMIFLFFYLKRTENGEYLFYCLQLCFGLPVVLELCNYWPIFVDNKMRFTILGFAWVALNVAHPIFLHRIYNLERVWVERILWFYLALVIFIGVFFTDKSQVRLHGIILIISAVSVGFYNFSCHVSALVKKSPYAKTFSFFGVTVVLCAIHDGFVYFSKFSGYPMRIFSYEPTIMIFHVGAILLYTGTALILVTRFIDVTDEVENLNESLENFIIENSMLSEKLEKTLNKRPAVSISNLAEEKLKNVIKYINDNYLDDISREDLANSVGVHPDSLGKQFKKYTGHKLGDYIYELRVNEAARRLREEDTNIIDIAFDVGFESVRTFNRIFPKFMQTTPNNYRRLYRKDSD
ncbi:MAG: AraC family transcriptional regulator [Proteobacteria bacterium]|nr:AraC family transcriptional regulator [Pseudomonadota bacterium]